jgi:ABC-type enterobactin transport system permease subunit
MRELQMNEMNFVGGGTAVTDPWVDNSDPYGMGAPFVNPINELCELANWNQISAGVAIVALATAVVLTGPVSVIGLAAVSIATSVSPVITVTAVAAAAAGGAVIGSGIVAPSGK